jgi:hypothetical protein
MTKDLVTTLWPHMACPLNPFYWPDGWVGREKDVRDVTALCEKFGIDNPLVTLELRISNAAAQTRIVSKARIRLDFRKSVRSFKGIICGDISEFESYMPSQAVGSPSVVIPAARRQPM